MQRWFDEVINGGQLDAIDEICSPAYVEAGESVGPDGPKDYFTRLRAASPDFQVTVEEIIAEDDKVVARWVFRGTHQGEYVGIAPTGRQVTITGITIWRVVDGQFVETWENKDELGMMQQLGVIPPIGDVGD